MTDQPKPAATEATDLRQRIAEALAREDVNWGYDHGFGLDPQDSLDDPETAAFVDAVHAAFQPELDRLADYENRITWHTSCGSCARVLDSAIRETERAEQAENRLRLAHQARRGKEQQLDGIRRALCDVGAMRDDDPYSHADLEDVIRQALAPTTETDATEPPGTVTAPAYLRKQYAAAVRDTVTHIADLRHFDTQIADVVLCVRDRHLQQLRQRLRLADQAHRDDLAAEPAPAHDAGPSVRQAAADDLRWWNGEKTGEQP